MTPASINVIGAGALGFRPKKPLPHLVRHITFTTKQENLIGNILRVCYVISNK
jgi:hypothetical protein